MQIPEVIAYIVPTIAWQNNVVHTKRVRLSTHPSFFALAAAAIVIAATAIVAGAQQAATATAVAQQNENQDNPTNIAAAETVIITHNKYLRNLLR